MRCGASTSGHRSSSYIHGRASSKAARQRGHCTGAGDALVVSTLAWCYRRFSVHIGPRRFAARAGLRPADAAAMNGRRRLKAWHGRWRAAGAKVSAWPVRSASGIAVWATCACFACLLRLCCAFAALRSQARTARRPNCHGGARRSRCWWLAAYMLALSVPCGCGAFGGEQPLSAWRASSQCRSGLIPRQRQPQSSRGTGSGTQRTKPACWRSRSAVCESATGKKRALALQPLDVHRTWSAPGCAPSARHSTRIRLD